VGKVEHLEGTKMMDRPAASQEEHSTLMPLSGLAHRRSKVTPPSSLCDAGKEDPPFPASSGVPLPRFTSSGADF